MSVERANGGIAELSPLAKKKLCKPGINYEVRSYGLRRFIGQNNWPSYNNIEFGIKQTV